MVFGLLGAIFGARDQQREADEQNRINRLTAEFTYQQQIRDRAAEIANTRNQMAYANARLRQELAIAQATANQEWLYTNALNRFNYIREKTNATLDWQYRTAAQKMDWQLQQTLQDAEYRASIRAFEQSEKTYAEQLRLNANAANRAYEDAQQQLRFSQMAAIVESDEVRRQTSQQQGSVAASGRAGASMARLQMDAQQQYARELGTLATNLAFSKAEFLSGQADAWLAQQSANAEADSRRLLRPLDKINIPRPVAIPRAYVPEPITLPRPAINEIRPIRMRGRIDPPEPIKGPVPVAQGPSTGSIIAGIGSGIMSDIIGFGSVSRVLNPPAATSDG